MATKKKTLPNIDDFLLSLQTDNYSDETVYNYERDLTVFEHFLSDISTQFERIDKKTINQYKAYLYSIDRKTAKDVVSDKRLQSYSMNRHLSSLRSYLRFLIEMDYESPIAPEVIKLVRTERKHPQVAEMDEIVRLIESPTQLEQKKIIALRNRAMLEALFSTGMRISELLKLQRQQIDGRGRVFIRGKGKKERFVYLTVRAMRHIQEYLKYRTDPFPALFIPYRGRHSNDAKKKISPNYLQMKIKEYRERLRINIPISAHSLRHGFATYLAEQGANPAAIQILLGHESLDTTTRYVNASDAFAESSHKKFHPLK